MLITKKDVPELDIYSGSWVVSRKDNGKVVFETFSKESLLGLIAEKVVIETAYQYLTRIG